MSDGRLYYYVCGKCGSIADIAFEAHPSTVHWACADCGSEALWEIRDKDEALRQANEISALHLGVKP